MSYINLRFENVGFSYPASLEPIINNLTVSFQKGWTGIVGPNGIGKTTLSLLATGIFKPDKGTIIRNQENIKGLYCAQTTEFKPEYFTDFFESKDNDSGKLRSILGIKTDWVNRWANLSHGERKRVQVGIMLWQNPDILALDEPTNHLDKYSSDIITESLKTFEGIGLLISHDRKLLDLLCSQCLFMETENITMRPGGFSEGLQQQEIEEKNKFRIYENSVEKYNKIKMSAQKLSREFQSKEKLLSKRNLDRKDFDGKAKVDAARLGSKPKKASQKVKMMERKKVLAGQKMEDLYFKKRRIDGFTLKGEKAKSNILWIADEGNIIIENYFNLIIPQLVIHPEDKIGLTGDNGAGKSTFIGYLNNSLTIFKEKVVYIPQEIDNIGRKKIMQEVEKLNREDLGKLLTVIFRLGSEPDRVMNTENPSPGELRKIMLGLGLLKIPNFIIMDEPTNHMDLPSIRALEKALSEFEGALLLVSHDYNFIKNLTSIEWNIILSENERKLIVK